MPRLVVLVAVALALAGCGRGEAGDTGGGPNAPVSGPSGSSAPGPSSAVVRQVAGTVRDDSGRPVRGALVVPRPVDAGTPAVPEIAVVSDAAGRFSWPLQPGRYELSAQLGERRSPPVPLTVRGASTSLSVELVLPD